MSKVERVNQPIKKILVSNFLGGIAWSIGVTLGASFVIALIGFIISKIDFVPFVGTFVSNVVEFVQENNSPFNKGDVLVDPES